MPNLDAISFLSPSAIGSAIEVTVASIASPTELNSRAAAQGDLILARTIEAGTGTQTLYYADTTSDAELLPYIVSSATAGVKFVAVAGRYVNQAVGINGALTLVVPLASTSGGTGVNNAGTITNASNTIITGGGTFALGGFTLTVPATGTAGLLGVANNWSLANTFSLATGTSVIVSSTTDSTTKDTGSIVTEGGLGVEKAIFAGTNITAAAVIRSTAASGAAQLRVDSVDAAISRPSNAFYCMGGGGFDQGISLGPSGGVSIYQVANAAWRCTTSVSTDNLYVDFARWTWRDPSDGFNEKMTLFNGLLTLPVTTGVTLTVSSTNIAAITCAGGIKTGSTTLHSTSAALTNGAAAQAGTLLNAPAAGNPTKWVPIDDNGTTRYIPCW